MHPLRWWKPLSGIQAFQHPSLVEILKEMSHENRLMELMQIILISENGVWKGTVEQLETQLLEDSTYKKQLEKYARTS